jgi:hypothetical protein
MAIEADFTYGPPLQGCNIRLIETRLSSEKTTLEINLIERWPGSVKFEALSYVWGKQAMMQRIKSRRRLRGAGSPPVDWTALGRRDLY